MHGSTGSTYPADFQTAKGLKKTMAQPLNYKNKRYSMIRLYTGLSLITLFLLFSGCEVIGGIFKAGVWVGILIVLGVIGLIVWLVTRGRRS
jgi:hypothetical protein